MYEMPEVEEDTVAVVRQTTQGRNTKLNNCRCYIPARYVLVMLIFTATCVSYSIRTVMSLTIVAMVNKTALRELEGDCSVPTDSWCFNKSGPSDVDTSACPMSNSTRDELDDTIEGKFVWKSETQGIILGCFFYGYACALIIAGRLVDVFGPKWLIGGGIFLGSLLTCLVPISAEIGVVALVALRVLCGVTQACVYPGISAILNRWIPPNDRSRFFVLSTSGASLGMILAMPVTGWLCQQKDFLGGWPSVFYMFGAAGCLWTILWLSLTANDPVSHPRISLKERAFLVENIPPTQSKKSLKFPWRAVLTSIPVWAATFAWATSSWIFYTRLTLLPNYLDQVLHFPIQKNGLVNAMINIVWMGFSISGGFISDYLLSSRRLSKTNVRKLMECTALLGSSISLIAVTLSGCDATMVLVFLTLSSGFQGLANSSDCVLPMDMAPTLSGSIYGFGSTFCSIGGFISPLIAGFILGIKGIDISSKWHYVFYLTSGLAILGSWAAGFLWTAEVQPWDPSAKDQSEDLSNMGDDNDATFEKEHPKTT